MIYIGVLSSSANTLVPGRIEKVRIPAKSNAANLRCLFIGFILHFINLLYYYFAILDPPNTSDMGTVSSI